MLFLLSPAKRLDFDSSLPPALQSGATAPRFAARAGELIELLRPLPAAEVGRLMHLSPALAQLNATRYAAWSKRATARNSRPALRAFAGDVYEGLDAASLDADDLGWAQQHLVILSGLYGVLRPLDRLQPYRLEMGTSLANPAGRDLYAFWRPTVTAYLNRCAKADASPVVVNLASQEYFGAVDRATLRPRVVDCVFEDWKNGRWQVIGFFAKRARGLMARHAITQRIATPHGLERFDAEGYAFDAAASQPERLVFRRRLDDSGTSS